MPGWPSQGLLAPLSRGSGALRPPTNQATAHSVTGPGLQDPSLARGGTRSRGLRLTGKVIAPKGPHSRGNLPCACGESPRRGMGTRPAALLPRPLSTPYGSPPLSLCFLLQPLPPLGLSSCVSHLLSFHLHPSVSVPSAPHSPRLPLSPSLCPSPAELHTEASAPSVFLSPCELGVTLPSPQHSLPGRPPPATSPPLAISWVPSSAPGPRAGRGEERQPHAGPGTCLKYPRWVLLSLFST